MTTWNNYDPDKLVTGYPVQPYPAATDNANPNPYAPSAPPAPTDYNPDFPLPEHHEHRGSNLCDKLCQFVIIAFVIALLGCLLVGAVILIVWLPKVSVSDFRVNSISIPSFNTSSESTVNWNVDFVVGNPTNRKIVLYDSLSVSAFYQEDFLGGTMTSPLVLNGMTTTTMTVKFSTLGTILNNVYHRNSSGQNLGTVGLNFKLKDSGVGTLSGGSQKCRVYAPSVICISFTQSMSAWCIFL
ncbi:hypothetical protein ACHQM5_019482 [Ranunculus cassubicifolius]